MGIVRWPEDVKPREIVTCVICGNSISATTATAGRHAEGQQAFACNSHFFNGTQFIVGWADFITDLVYSYLDSGRDPADLDAQDAMMESCYMGDCYIEERQLGANSRSLPGDLACHLLTRQFCGRAIVVTDKPAIMRPAVAKQWQMIKRRIHREISSTLKATRFDALSRQLSDAQRIRFVDESSPDIAEDDVLLVTSRRLLDLSLTAQTVYLACAIDEKTEMALRILIPNHGLMVRYDLNPGPSVKSTVHRPWNWRDRRRIPSYSSMK